MSDYSEKELLEIDFMIDELENKVQILQRKIGITIDNKQNQIDNNDSNQSQ